MPTYEYECQKCGHRFDLFQSIKDEPRKRCPECRGKVKRLLGTGAGLIFKGTGFYTTDYRSDSYQKAAKSESDVAKTTSDTATKPDAAAPKEKKTEKPKDKK